MARDPADFFYPPMNHYNLVSLAGIFVLIAFALLISENRRRQNWRLTFGGIAVVLFLGLLIFQFPGGVYVFQAANDILIKLTEVSAEGARFLFGPLAFPPGSQGSLGFILAFQALPTIVFFSALMSLLYYLRIMPWLIDLSAKIFTRLFRTSGAESLCVSTTHFVGIESILTIRPHLQKMTRSELHTIITAGLATVASNVMALYIFTLHGVFPSIAGHLVTATVLAAPASLVFSKILVPETGEPETLGRHIKVEYKKDGSFIEAIVNGSTDGMKLIMGIIALLLSVLGLVALLDSLMGSVTGAFLSQPLTLKTITGYLFYPFILITGVPFEDAFKVAMLVGERLIVTEVVSYQDLAILMGKNEIGQRSAVIAAYALCGFTHFASLAIFAGGVAAMAPDRTKDIASITMKSLVAATLSTLSVACVAGIFFTGQSFLMGG